MNKAETIKVMAVLQANYPDSFRGMTKDAVEGRISLWMNIFESDSYMEVTAAVMAHIASDTERFMPPVGVIKNKLVALKGTKELTELEAWSMVSKAISRSNYYAQEEYDKLPELVQKAVGTPEMLKQWAQLKTDEVETVIQSNFMRSFRAKQKQSKDVATLPDSVKALMGNAVKMIGDGNGN